MEECCTMGSIIGRTRKDGTTAYLAQILIKRKGKIVHREHQTFDRKQAAKAWLSRQEPASRPAHQSCFAPSRATAMLVDADNGSVDHLDGAIMSFGEGLHDQVPDASRSPANEPVVAGRIRPNALRQIAPWCA